MCNLGYLVAEGSRVAKGLIQDGPKALAGVQTDIWEQVARAIASNNLVSALSHKEQLQLIRDALGRPEVLRHYRRRDAVQVCEMADLLLWLAICVEDGISPYVE